MKTRALALLIAFSAAHAQEPERLPAATPNPRTAEELAAQTVVVFNQNDLDSTALAGLYAEKRGIPNKNLVGLDCTKLEEITRDTYDRTIAEPLRKVFAERGWWKLLKEPGDAGKVEKTNIRFVVLMRGVPLKISSTGAYQGDETGGAPAEVFGRNEAAVDSELSILGLWSRRISGVLVNPYFRDGKNIAETELTSQLLVCRLDAATPATVQRMIEDSIATEKTGLRGLAYIDAQGIKTGGLAEGDRWLKDAARDAREHGIPVAYDNGPALFPPQYPMKNCALYLGWYSDHVLGPFTQPGFRFTPGAVAVHIHSFSALSLRDPKRLWCAPLLEVGAACTLGNVYEPYLGITPRLDYFSQRIREGFTFAEAAYMSQPYLSWMTTFIGDPLYRPFLNSNAAPPKPGNEWDAYRAGVALWLSKGRPAGETALRDSATQLKSGVISEGMGLLEMSGGDNNAAITAFQQSRATYSDADDRIRVAIHESSAIRAAKGDAAANAFLKQQAEANSSSDKAELLKLLMSPAPQPAKPAKPTTPAKPKAR